VRAERSRKPPNHARESAQIAFRISDWGERNFSPERLPGFAHEWSLIDEMAKVAGPRQNGGKAVGSSLAPDKEPAQTTSQDFFGAIAGGRGRERIPAHHVTRQVEDENAQRCGGLMDLTQSWVDTFQIFTVAVLDGFVADARCHVTLECCHEPFLPAL
jgi:hypothetical protein